MIANNKSVLLLGFLVVHAAFAGIPSVFRNEEEDDGEVTPTIVGGSPAYQGELKYQVQMLYGGRPYCGGSIIGPRTVVTAAHCVEGTSASQFQVRAGHISNSNPGPYAQTIQVSQIIIHPQWDSRSIRNDIAILKLNSPFQFNSYVNQIAIPQQGSGEGSSAGTNLIASGWGNTRGGGQSPDQLLKVTLPVISYQQCNNAYQGSITQNQVCAGNNGKSTCNGDSGGPLATPGGGSLIGVVSFGVSCDTQYYPAVFTKVASYSSWLQQYCN